MAQNSDFKDFYIRGTTHPNYEENVFVAEDLMLVILQKLEMILYTNKGDVIGDPYIGADLEYYLWSTKVPSSEIEKKINQQIYTYIPELVTMGYDLSIEIYEGTVRDIMYVRIKIKGYRINFILD